MKQLFFYNNNVYLILRRLNLSYIIDKNNNINNELLKIWKEGVGADHVLKTDAHFLLCETITETEWSEIEEI